MARHSPTDEPERSRHEVVPLGDPAAPALDPRLFEGRSRLPPPPHERAPAPEPAEAEETDLDRLVEVLAGGEQELQEDEIREAFEGSLDEAWEPAPEGRGDESGEEHAEQGEVNARFREATRRRRQQSLDLVILLQDELAEELEAAQEAGDVGRVRWLSASARRLAVRRAALERALSGLASDRGR